MNSNFFNGCKLIFSAVFSISSLLIFSSNAGAESLFLKNGSIIEGTIVSETNANIKFKYADGKTNEVPRTEVMRVVHHEDFKVKKYIYKSDNSLVEAFIVDEDKLNYTYRVDLNSANEFKMLKSEIETISKKKSEPASAKITRKEDIMSRESLIRLGLTGAAPLFNTTSGFADNWLGPFRGSTLDIFLWRERNQQNSGFDIFTRGMINHYTNVKPSALGYATPAYDTVKFSSITFEDSEITQFSAGPGLRYINGVYAGGILWQGYFSFYYQYSYVSFASSYQAILTIGSGWESIWDDHKMTSHGFAGGIGFEAGLLQNFGIFGEFTYGYSAAFPANKNIEGGSFNFGVTLRTSIL